MCLFDIHVLYGRYADDSDGNYNGFSNDGANLVDNMIASSNTCPYVRHVRVLNKDKSDHSPLSCGLEFITKPDLNVHIDNVETLTPIEKYL